MNRKVLLGVGLGLLVLLGAVQLVPVERTNPPVETEIDAPPDVMNVLERSCYDCHSHESEWPWYAYVAPASWLVTHDVEEAREHLNFSTWNRYDTEEKAEHIEEIWEEVEEGEMPLSIYLPLHPEARLSDADREVLRRWAQRAGGGGTGHDDEEHEH